MGKVGSSPAIGADGTIYVGSWDGKLYAVNPDGTEKWVFTTLNQIQSSPAIADDGTIYFGCDDGKVYAVYSDSPGLANSPWPKYRHDKRNTGQAAKTMVIPLRYEFICIAFIMVVLFYLMVFIPNR